MTLLYHDGFDFNDHTLRWTQVTNYPTSVVSSRGGRILQMDNNYSIQKAVPTSSRLIAGAMVSWTGNTGAADALLLGLYGDAGATQHVSVYMSGAANALVLKRGTTVIGTFALPWVASQWHYVEVSATVSDTVGRAIVRLDGVVVIDFTGDTKNAGTATTLDAVRMSSSTSTSNFWIDDLYILNDQGSVQNDFLGEVRVLSLAPTGAGNSTQLTPSTGANWSCVDETPYSSTDYVQGSTVGLKDTYATADLPAGVTAVHAVNIVAIAKKTDTGARALRTLVRSGGTDYADAGTGLLVSDAAIVSQRLVDPATSAAWTVAGVNAMEIGVEVA